MAHLSIRAGAAQVNFEANLFAMHGLSPGGRVHRFAAESVMRHADKYVPFQSGVLASSARVEDDCAVSYNTPYARYLYYGKLMVDPVTKKGAFHDPVSGRFWSRPNTPKVLSDRPLRFSGAPMRGAYWAQRMWIAEGDDVIRETQAYLERG